MAEIENTSFLPQFVCDNDQLLDDTEVETNNGLHLNNVYIPEEIVLHIFTFVDPKELLKCSLICRKWNKLIKSYTLWSAIYRRKHHKKSKQLPWYLFYCLLTTNYFNNNLLRNGNGQEKFSNWQLTSNGGNGFAIEDPPMGSDPLPLNVPEFCNHTSCFATSYGECYKIQKIKLGNSGLFRYILNTYKPPIYLSEWVAGRFDCGCIYKLRCALLRDEISVFSEKPCAIHQVEQWKGSKWKKIEMTISEYPEDIEQLAFEHMGCDTQYWAGHYGSKMAGSVLKLLFDSIEPLTASENGKEKPKVFSEIKYDTNGEKELPEVNSSRGYFFEEYLSPPAIHRCAFGRRRRRIPPI